MCIKSILASVLLAVIHSHGSIGQSSSVQVPTGSPPIIDGIIEPHEWEDAAQLPIHGAEGVLVKQANGRLYIGIKGDTGGFASVGLATADSIHILHASTGLITASYVRHDDGWRRIHDFEGPVTQSGGRFHRDELGSTSAYRLAQYAQFGWYANLVGTGLPTDMEYEVQIRNPESDGMYMSIVLFQAHSQVRYAHAPVGLDDASLDRDLIEGSANTDLQFNPASWIKLNW